MTDKELLALYLAHFGDRSAWTPGEQARALRAVFDAGRAATHPGAEPSIVAPSELSLRERVERAQELLR